MSERNCGTCGFSAKECGEMCCANEQGEYYTDFVDENHVCDLWESDGESECE